MGLRGVTGEPIPSALVPAFMYGSYGQLGALLAIILKTKDKKVKKFGLANILTGLLPISGPIVYGATLPMV
jgi:phosphotransferase system  glucose/maltose/N-acetylglucosamine-specific IIC component